MDELLLRHKVRIRGATSTRPVLVFVHGFGTDQRAWDRVAALLEADYRIVVLDNAGAGGAASFEQHRYLDLHAYAADLERIVRALDLRGAVFVGHSVGAAIAALASLRCPEACARLVLLACSPRYRDAPGYHGGFSDADLRELYRAITANYPEWAERYAPIAMANPEQPQLARDFATALKAVPADHALTVLASIFQSDHRDDFRRIAVPTLLLQARQDPFVPPDVAEWLRMAIPGGRLQWLDAAGHLPHIAAPASVATAIRGFVAAGPHS